MWTRDEPDPLKARRRELEEQQRRLNEKMSRLHEELRNGGKPAVAGEKKAPEPPLWRLEDDAPRAHVPDGGPGAGRRRNLGRQRQRDMIIFFICMGLLLVTTVIFLWLWKTHVPTGG